MSDIAKLITDKLFKLGDEPNRPCLRIAFMSGHYSNEKQQGALNKDAFYQTIKKWIEDPD